MICIYCGDIGSEWDHVPPKCKRHLYPSSTYKLVESCFDCNRMLKGNDLPTIELRKEFLIKKYKIKYGKILRIPEWSNEELLNLGMNLRIKVIESLVKRSMILKRLLFLQGHIDYI